MKEQREIQMKVNAYNERQIRAFIVRHNLILNRDFLDKAQIGVYVLSQFIRNETKLDELQKKRLFTGVFWYIRQSTEVQL